MMFRSLRQGRNIFSMSRLPLRTEAQRQNGEIREIYKVKFRRAIVRPKIIIANLVGMYVGFQIYKYLVFGPLVKYAVEDLPDEEEEEDFTPFFIPLIGTTKQLKPVPYRGTDPEWKEFIKFSKDQKQAQNVRDELAAFVQGVAAKHPILTLRCGKEMKLRRYWLDVDFPPTAPPEFERIVIEFPDDELPRLGVQKVDSLLVFKIRGALWPSPLAQSTWSFLKVMVKDEYKKIASKLGLSSSPPPPSLEQIIARHQQLMKNPQAPSPDGPPAQPSVMGTTPKAISNGPSEKSAIAGKGDQEIEINPAAKIVHAHFMRPIMAFRAKLAQTWRPAQNFPPRGSLLVSGLVEIDSPKAWLVFDVHAAYDPKDKEFDPRSMKVELRRFQLKKQGPVGPGRPPPAPIGPPPTLP